MTEPLAGESNSGALAASVSRELTGLLSRALLPGLYLLATPIGNLGDISLRALAIMAQADRLYCEDTRHSRRLLDRFGITRKLRSYHDHNESEQLHEVLGELAQGRALGLMSDAGTPLISDPGFKLVRAALEAGHKVFAVPGASAVLAALSASGLASDCFTFVGFLPAKAGQRLDRLREFTNVTGTLIFFESPGRVEATLAALREVFGGHSPAAIARELTKLHEEMRRGSLDDLLAWARSQEIRGEVVILVAPMRSADTEASDEEIDTALSQHSGGSLRDRVDAVATLLRAPRKKVYDLALRLRKD